jgi:hypothetical protein
MSMVLGSYEVTSIAEKPQTKQTLNETPPARPYNTGCEQSYICTMGILRRAYRVPNPLYAPTRASINPDGLMT